MQDRASWNENQYADDYEPDLEEWQQVEPVREVVCKRLTLVDDAGHRRMQSWVEGDLALTTYFDQQDKPILTIAARLNGDGLISFPREGDGENLSDVFRIVAGATDAELILKDEVFGNVAVLTPRGVVTGSEV